MVEDKKKKSPCQYSDILIGHPVHDKLGYAKGAGFGKSFKFLINSILYR